MFGNVKSKRECAAGTAGIELYDADQFKDRTRCNFYNVESLKTESYMT